MIMISDPVISRHMKKSSRISFNQCGVEYCSPGHSYGPRVRWYCIIHFILEGQGRLIIHKQQYDVHAGDAFLIPANAEGYYAADYERPWKYFWLSFSGTEAENYCSLIFGKEVFVKKITDMDALWKQMKQIAAEFFFKTGNNFKEKTESNPSVKIPSDLEFFDPEKLHSGPFCCYTANSLWESLLLNAGTYNILSLLLYSCQKTGIQDEAFDQDNYAEKIKNYIDSYFTEFNGIKQVADLFHLHPNYLNDIFRKSFYISPKRYLLNRKLEYANHLLTETDYSIQSISSACGFLNVSSFGKIYKKYMGVSPSKYRIRNRKQGEHSIQI